MNQVHELGLGDYTFLAFVVFALWFSLSFSRSERRKYKYRTWCYLKNDPGGLNDTGIHPEWESTEDDSEGFKANYN